MNLISHRQRAPSLALISFTEVVSYQKVLYAYFPFNFIPSGLFKKLFILIEGLCMAVFGR